MKIDTWLIAGVIFSLVIITGVSFIKDIDEKYGTSINDEMENEGNTSKSFNATFYRLEQMKLDADNIKNKSIDAEAAPTDFIDDMFRSGLSTARTVSNSFGLVTDVTNYMEEQDLISPWMRIAFITIITLSISFAVLYLILRYNPSS